MYNSADEAYTNPDFTELIPIKNHILRLTMMLNGLEDDLKQSKVDMDQVKEKIKSNINEKQLKDLNDLQSYVLDESQRLNKELRELNSQERNDIYNLKHQVNTLTQDKIRMQQNTIVLENRVIETDKDIGFRFRIQPKQK